MNRKQNFQRMSRENPKMAQFIRARYYHMHFWDNIEEDREEEDIKFAIEINNIREKSKSIWSIL